MVDDNVEKLYTGPRTLFKSQGKEENFSLLHKRFLVEH